ncbi:MAG: hypothetical protein L7S72_05790, partial [Flavobacteriales bacterium]|nr:hypothetical protein [Flavobacteriales bacterium]
MKINKVIFFALSFAFVSFINAQITWDGSVSTAWSTADNWTPSGVPTSSDNVIIASSSNEPVIDIPGAVCNDLTIQSAAILISNNGSNKLTASGTVLIQSSGQISMTDGEIESNDFTHQGVLTMQGGTLLI